MRLYCSKLGLHCGRHNAFFHFAKEYRKLTFWLEQPNHHLIPADSEFYPPQLLATTDYPGALFVEGELHALHSFQLAVVGSRAHSWYGERWGRLFCETLATRGVTITSGLARGIDGVAHKAALQVNGVSIAVLGMDLIPFIRVAMPDWLPVCLNMVGLLSRNSPRCSSPCLQFPTKKSHYQWSK
ncbi:DNA protecting protein DprA [Escherichia coli]|uniref:DNA protecting protein DprA n=1 Tax=Escherichia coli TaxID=562 RepID=A0A377DBD0_ECOLX|nr:DNA protecting protein DprA [Escherichia coli]